MFRILITDASYKHSVALQRYIRQDLPDVELVGHDNGRCKLAKYYGYLSAVLADVPLQDVLTQGDFDMVIPVGADSVKTVSCLCPERAVLPSAESIDVCLDKSATMELADRVNVPRPRSERLRAVEGLDGCSIPYPRAIKPACETEAHGTRYAKNEDEFRSYAVSILSALPADSSHGLLVQEYVQGRGVGLFALYDQGRPVRIFMHQRIREYPVTGGASTAARAFYDETLKDHGLRLLSELQWNGVAMAEFKYDEASDRLVLMEINPKFWGSLELALRAGVNFGADLVRLYRGASLEYSEQYDRQVHFYWPLDGDLLNLIHTRSLGRIRDYYGPQAATDLGYSRIADGKRLARTLVKLVLGG